MDRPDWAPDGVDLSKPSIARSYDYLLHGSHNLRIDRDYTRHILEVLPDARMVALANRSFMHRAVRFMMAAGIRQFLDIGSGIPTVGNVHEIALRADPGARVVYVDIDPVAVAHSQLILKDNPQAVVIEEDFRRPEAILGGQSLLDLSQPVGLLVVAVLHAVPDADDPAGVLARLHSSLAPGSYVALSHGTADSRPAEVDAVVRLTQTTSTPITMRTHAQVEAMFHGLDLVPPGVVWAPRWRPESADDVDDQPERSSIYVGVARKPS